MEDLLGTQNMSYLTTAIVDKRGQLFTLFQSPVSKSPQT